MIFSLKRIYYILSVPENSGRIIGIFRIVCAIFGGFLVSFLAMGVFTLLIIGDLKASLQLPFILLTFTWAGVALWISLSYSKLIALLRVIVPSIVFAIIIAVLF